MVEWKTGGVKATADLVADYRRGRTAPRAEKINFVGVGERDVYNITAPFKDEGRLVIAGRVERRDSEVSEVWFFVQEGKRWVPLNEAPVFQLQDPFLTHIAGKLMFGGVQTFPHPEIAGSLSWRTVFYYGENLAGMRPFFNGPDQMKDLRLVELQDGGIGIFTRPQGEKKGGRGKIGFTRVETLEKVTVDVINEAPLLQQFLDDEWGGCNEIHLLPNGKLGILGHIARFDEQGDRHYYPMVFVLDPATGEYSEINVIAERADFLKGPSKRPDLVDVVFSGGLIRHGDGTADLYSGISDAEAQKLTIPDPFADLHTRKDY